MGVRILLQPSLARPGSNIPNYLKFHEEYHTKGNVYCSAILHGLSERVTIIEQRRN